MIRKYLLFAFLGLILCGVNSQVVDAQKSTDRELGQIKSDVRKLSARQDSRVTVVLKNGTKLKGVITQVLDDSFDVMVPNTKLAITLPYEDVKSVRKDGWPGGAKTALTLGIGAAVVVAIVVGTLAKKGPGGFCPLGCTTILRP